MPVNAIPLINGKGYAWANVALMIAGAPVTGVTAINYSDSEEKENTYGVGKYPIERGEGNYTATVELTLRASVLEELAAKVPNGRLQDFGVFDIQVSFLVGTVRHTHYIRNCEFTGNVRNMSQGAKLIEGSPGIICSHIDWQ